MRSRDVGLALYFALAAVALVYPGYAWLGNRIEPYVLGLPLSFAYNVAWILLTLVVLASYHLTEER